MFRSLFKLPITLLNKYNKALINSPYKTKMTTAGTTYFISDYICQNYIENKHENSHAYSPVRSLRQGSVGAFFAAPSLHVWHSLILPKIANLCRGGLMKVAVSVFLNETVLASYFISILLFSFETLKTLSIKGGIQNVQDKFVPALGASIRFWTGISIINYSLVPIHLRPVFVSIWSIVWQTYLSYVSNNKLEGTREVLPVRNTEEEEKEDDQLLVYLINLQLIK